MRSQVSLMPKGLLSAHSRALPHLFALGRNPTGTNRGAEFCGGPVRITRSSTPLVRSLALWISIIPSPYVGFCHPSHLARYVLLSFSFFFGQLRVHLSRRFSATPASCARVTQSHSVEGFICE